LDIYSQLNDAVNKILESLYDEAPKPDYVYHYTSQAALHSMIAKGELWLNSIRGTNDPLEGVFGSDIIRRVVEHRLPGNEVVEIMTTTRTEVLPRHSLRIDGQPTLCLSLEKKTHCPTG
jgi:hypothetical protein